jgi:hypothetical protein
MLSSTRRGIVFSPVGKDERSPRSITSSLVFIIMYLENEYCKDSSKEKLKFEGG